MSQRGSLLLAIALAATAYVAMVAKAELSLSPQLQLALFESRHELPLIDDQTAQSALALQTVLPPLSR